MGNKSQSGNNDFLTGNLPLLKPDRVYSFFDNTCMDVAMAIATWCFMTGGTLALFVGVWDSIVATIAGQCSRCIFRCYFFIYFVCEIRYRSLDYGQKLAGK